MEIKAEFEANIKLLPFPLDIRLDILEASNQEIKISGIPKNKYEIESYAMICGQIVAGGCSFTEMLFHWMENYQLHYVYYMEVWQERFDISFLREEYAFHLDPSYDSEKDQEVNNENSWIYAELQRRRAWKHPDEHYAIEKKYYELFIKM